MERWAGGGPGVSCDMCGRYSNSLQNGDVLLSYKFIRSWAVSFLLTHKTSHHYELHLCPPACRGRGQEPATVHTFCNFPKVVFLMVTGMDGHC